MRESPWSARAYRVWKYIFAIGGCVLIVISIAVLIGVPFSIIGLLRSFKVALLGGLSFLTAWACSKAGIEPSADYEETKRPENQAGNE